ncbi:type II secretion system F family protein [Vreelandella titanicae]|uniref:type II secretion system F family protein n=1 Tax=Vreelandella titanicae TaxID=664683 RepID=UPI003D0559CA
MVIILSLFIALLAAFGAYIAGKTLMTSATKYQQTFKDSAEHNLAEMFLFIEPQKLFFINIVFLILVFVLVLLSGAGVGIALLVSAALGASPPLVYRYLRKRRRFKAVHQLPDALTAIANNMSSGLSLTQSLETTIAFERPPLSQELGLVLRELRIGVPFEETMNNLYQRLPETEVQLVTSAMTVSREIGGNLSETLLQIASTLRKRLQVEGKIRSLTAQGKLQGLVMTGLPIFLVIALNYMQPEAMSYLFTEWYGWATVGVIVVLEAIGYHIIYKIVSIDV